MGARGNFVNDSIERRGGKIVLERKRRDGGQRRCQRCADFRAWEIQNHGGTLGLLCVANR